MLIQHIQSADSPHNVQDGPPQYVLVSEIGQCTRAANGYTKPSPYNLKVIGRSSLSTDASLSKMIMKPSMAVPRLCYVVALIRRNPICDYRGDAIISGNLCLARPI